MIQRFDGGVFFGREPKYGLEFSNERVLSMMDRTNTRMGLSTNLEAIFFDMYEGNRKTLELSRLYPNRCLPMAVINPQHYDIGSDYIETLAGQGFRGVSFFLHYQFWKSTHYTFRALVKRISKAGLPIQIAIASLDDLSETADAVAELKTPVLIRWVRGGGYLNTADVITIASLMPHIYFDVSNLVQLGGVAYLAEKIGTERLYLASNMPVVYESCGHFLVDTAELSVKDKEQISYGTLAGIFSVAENTSTESAEDKNVYGFDHIERPKIDTHWHAEGWDIIEPKTDAASLKKVLDDFHYEAVISSSILALNYDMSQGNANTNELTRQDPRIFGYLVYDPTRVEESLEELEKYKNNPSFVGIKTIQDYYPAGLDDERYLPMLRWAEEHDWPILAHKTGAAGAARAFPKVQFVIAHITADRMPEFKGIENLVVDISASYAHRGESDVAKVIKELGADRVLYAADGPLMTPAWSIGKIVSSNLDEDILEKIYKTNALRVYKRLHKALEV
ncbi:MAG: amidohydrolase family protein [Candidatus Magasanikbacteria bacterium]|nr:amidohydrolase family protein [Candidatus Magasanikbacteria bacterium]